MIRIPPRGIYPECFINPSYVVSIYYARNSLYIELQRTTISLVYSSEEETLIALRKFVSATSDPSIDTSEPKPINGGIRVN